MTDTTIKNAKHGSKPIKLTDGRGMYLLLQPSGGELWKMKYRIGDKEKKLSFGSYPDVSLKDARNKRDEARAKIANKNSVG
ncbi:Arm DNA-binding domain-containing protein [Sphingomonas sp. Root710]|uniref:Arm DNA-binding domain-containing protein n=1 Tax=Sphingomonas sp. Root710 TaxID=1736594 RepID=UPI001F18DD9A|nr:Arm DNA-binding domain-containing protein [Sphingomonas sp. Root710]